MVSSEIPDVLLPGSSARRIPLLGYGTAEFPFGASPQTVKQSVLHAIKLGYRHFDTASLYLSEQPLGEAIQEALIVGLINSRDELFITSKLSVFDAHLNLVVPAIQRTLENLQLDYLDLYLIHFPVSLKPGDNEYPFKKEQIIPMDLKSVWGKMEECQKLGFTKSIGVSNFTCKKLETLLTIATIRPAVNQVEINPVWKQEKLRKYCKGKGIHVTAFSPLGAKGTGWGSNWVMDCDALKEIAEARGKSIAQVCLRWVYEQGVSVVVKSFNKERMKENMDIFDWELSPEDKRKIREIRQRRCCRAMDFVHNEGPYRSLVELWDGEIEEWSD